MNRRMRRLMRRRGVPLPTGRSALLLLATAVPAALAAAAAPSAQWLVFGLALAAAAVVVFGDALRAVAPGAIEVDRHFPSALAVGATGHGSWRVALPHDDSRSGAPQHVRVSVRDALWPSLGASSSGGWIELGDEPSTLRTELHPTRRGRFPFGAVTVRTRSPLGLVEWQATRDVPGTLIVTPAYRSQSKLAGRRVPLESGLRAVRAKGTGTDFEQLRDYRAGDDFRRVDWAATARSQRAVVREYRAERNQQVIVLLDNGRAMAGTVDGVPRVELAMDAVLGLADVATNVGDAVGLVTFGSQVRAIVPPRQTRSHFGRIAEAMYLLEPEYAQSAYDVALRTAAAHFRRRSLMVVFTDFSEAVVWDSLEPAVAALSRTHLVIVAAVTDPSTRHWADAPADTTPGAATAAPSSASSGALDGAVSGAGSAASTSVAPVSAVTAAFRSAAAVLAEDDRERAAARLRAVGAIVVDATPDDLAVAVVDRYLELKASGRL